MNVRQRFEFSLTALNLFIDMQTHVKNNTKLRAAININVGEQFQKDSDFLKFDLENESQGHWQFC